MEEMIQSIHEVDGVNDKMVGYQVTTNQHQYRVLIRDQPSCCEQWGYITSEDDLSGYVGSTLLAVKLTDTALRTAVMQELEETDFDCGGIQFVDFVTDKGVFQLAVYNSHNGYYGHRVRITKDEEVLLDSAL